MNNNSQQKRQLASGKLITNTKNSLIFLIVALLVLIVTASAQAQTPVPLITRGQSVDWWFVFKFNDSTFPGCDGSAQRSCPFGGTVQDYKNGAFSQQYVYASSSNPSLQKGTDCLGDTLTDPVGATFDQAYNGSFYYVLWNDQFYGDPMKTKAAPWGHSKGMVSWNENGEGFVMQVSTPSWPASGNKASPRRNDGNTLGCVTDNDVKVSQHFFALKLTKDDLIIVLSGLKNASVVTDPSNAQIVRNGGPADVQALVKTLGEKTAGKTRTSVELSSGVRLISKPSGLQVPPWQMVSASLHQIPLRTATWWANPYIPTTTSTTVIDCWDSTLGTSGPVEIATSGHWGTTKIGLKGVTSNGNHAKIGVSTDSSHPYVIFGDLNQQGALSGNCKSSQNGRGGLFFVLQNKPLYDTVSTLLEGDTSPAP